MNSSSRIFDALRRLTRHARLADTATRQETGLSIAQLGLLRAIVATPHITLSEIAARMHTDISSVSTVIKRLIDLRLVTRQPDPSDRRKARLTITERGESELRRAPRSWDELLLEAMHTIGERELNNLADGLDVLVESLELGDHVHRQITYGTRAELPILGHAPRG